MVARASPNRPNTQAERMLLMRRKQPARRDRSTGTGRSGWGCMRLKPIAASSPCGSHHVQVCSQSQENGHARERARARQNNAVLRHRPKASVPATANWMNNLQFWTQRVTKQRAVVGIDRVMPRENRPARRPQRN